MKTDPAAALSLEALRNRHVALRLQALATGERVETALTVTGRRIARSLAILSHSHEEIAKSAHLLGTRHAADGP
jgi:hypothetical protein